MIHSIYFRTRPLVIFLTTNLQKNLSDTTRWPWRAARQRWLAWSLGLHFFLSTNQISAEEAQVLSVRLVPEVIELVGLGATQQCVLMGQYSDGLKRDVSSRCNWRVSDEKIASVDGQGRIKGIGNGDCELTATFEGQSAQREVSVSHIDENRPFRFARNIGTILNRQGCNSTECHGSVPGKGGFKLSHSGLHPREDYEWIVKGGTFEVLTDKVEEPRIPRVDHQHPEKSLLLLKPTMVVDHEGDLRFAVDSPEYRTLLEWIRAGTPYKAQGTDDGTGIDGIDVFPLLSVLECGGRQQLLVNGHRSEGGCEDITNEAVFEMTLPDVVEISPEGITQAVGVGTTVVIVRAAGHVATVQVAVVEQPLNNYPEVESWNLIDEHVFARLKKLHIVPARLSDDAEFLRRICLDLTGTLPPPSRVREFLADNDPQKRKKLIDILLDSPEYIDYWTFRLADLFRVEYNARQDVKSTQIYQEWIRDCVSQNKPFDQIALERIAAQGNVGPTQNYYFLGNRPTHQIAAEQARVFLGIRLDCAQCHDHPSETWSQNQFWELAAFFSGVKSMNEGGLGPALIYDDPKGETLHPRTKKKVSPTFLTGEPMLQQTSYDPRAQLAAWVTSDKNQFFSRAIVNRFWQNFFGRGIVHPVDDFRQTNPPTNSSLLDALAEDFEKHEYDLKHLLRQIVSSRTYQLSGEHNTTNQHDCLNHSRALPRALDAEILLDGICQVTGSPERFSSVGHPLAARGIEAVTPLGTRSIDLVPQLFPSAFLEMYGRHYRVIVQDRNTEPSLLQALHMYAGPTYTPKISQLGGRIDSLLERNAGNQEIIEELYLAALTRFPTAEEVAALESLIEQQSSRREAIEGLTWALLASREFTFNH